MKGYLLLSGDKIGEIEFKVIDESMGVIAGVCLPYSSYEKYQSQIQLSCEKKNIANIDDFDFAVTFDGKNILEPQGGIGVTDLKDFEEICVEVAGLPYETLKLIIDSEES